MASFFEMIAKVLDRAYEELESADKDKLISDRLDELSDHYANVLTNGGPASLPCARGGGNRTTKYSPLGCEPADEKYGG